MPVTVPDDRQVLRGRRRPGAQRFTVPGDGAGARSPAVAWAGRFYCADEATGTVYVSTRPARWSEGHPLPAPGGPLELEVRENHLFINAPGSSTARVVDDAHTVRVVDKYANDVLGGTRRRPATAAAAAEEAAVEQAGRAAQRDAPPPATPQARVTWQPAAAERRGRSPGTWWRARAGRSRGRRRTSGRWTSPG